MPNEKTVDEIEYAMKRAVRKLNDANYIVRRFESEGVVEYDISDSYGKELGIYSVSLHEDKIAKHGLIWRVLDRESGKEVVSRLIEQEINKSIDWGDKEGIGWQLR